MKWSDLSGDDKRRVLAWLRQEPGTPTAFPPKELLLAAADELETPTWEADTDPALGETKW